jgi:hypothetical protein
MDPGVARRDLVLSGDRLIAIAGNYGSGQTEVAVNLSLHLSRLGTAVHIADLDLVNPYFRCREAAGLMSAHGIRVVVPPGAQAFADLPIVLPEIAGMLHPKDGTISLFDVGGDDVGARALAALRPRLREGDYELWQVINAKRPFTDTIAGCLAMRQQIEKSSRWRVTGWLVNTHLIDETTPATILDGWRLGQAVSTASGLPIRLVAVMHDLADAPELADIDAPILRMTRLMTPPWAVPRPRELGRLQGAHT